MKRLSYCAASLLAAITLEACADTNYKIVDTGQSKCFDNTKEIEAPTIGDDFYGQDAQFTGNIASYTDNGDGTATDNITGLIWQKSYTVMSYKEALNAAKKFNLAGYNDWRIPTIKEAYSLILFSGSDVSPETSGDNGFSGTPFIDTTYFDFQYGANGNRPIDSQMLSSTLYVGSTDRENLIFGVNFADGRIKGYGLGFGSGDKQFLVRFVRGGDYGINKFSDNGDETISDTATSLMWSKADSKTSMNWEDALLYAQEMNKANYLGYSDWRVPNAKELQSIVDYTRSPKTTQSAAIDPIFEVTTITDEAGVDDYPFYWSSTTHESSGSVNGSAAVYVAFGRSLGNMSNSQGIGVMPHGGDGGGGDLKGGDNHRVQRGEHPPMDGEQRGEHPPMDGVQHGERPPMDGAQHGERPPMDRAQHGDHPRGEKPNHTQNHAERDNKTPNWVDIHGAGSQRSDPKVGDATQYADGHGPQGDAIRIYNYVRLVRDL